MATGAWPSVLARARPGYDCSHFPSRAHQPSPHAFRYSNERAGVLEQRRVEARLVDCGVHRRVDLVRDRATRGRGQIPERCETPAGPAHPFVRFATEPNRAGLQSRSDSLVHSSAVSASASPVASDSLESRGFPSSMFSIRSSLRLRYALSTAISDVIVSSDFTVGPLHLAKVERNLRLVERRTSCRSPRRRTFGGSWVAARRFHLVLAPNG